MTPLTVSCDVGAVAPIAMLPVVLSSKILESSTVLFSPVNFAIRPAVLLQCAAATLVCCLLDDEVLRCYLRSATADESRNPVIRANAINFDARLLIIGLLYS